MYPAIFLFPDANGGVLMTDVTGFSMVLFKWYVCINSMQWHGFYFIYFLLLLYSSKYLFLIAYQMEIIYNLIL